MLRILTSILIILFAGFAVFGLSFMTHPDNGAHDGCLAGGAFGSVCPQDIGSFSMIDLHFDALEQFSSATFSGLPTLAALLLLGFVFVVVAGIGIRIAASAIGVFMKRRGLFDALHSSFRRQLIAWLALHNRKNPSLLCVSHY